MASYQNTSPEKARILFQRVDNSLLNDWFPRHRIAHFHLLYSVLKIQRINKVNNKQEALLSTFIILARYQENNTKTKFQKAAKEVSSKARAPPLSLNTPCLTSRYASFSHHVTLTHLQKACIYGTLQDLSQCCQINHTLPQLCPQIVMRSQHTPTELGEIPGALMTGRMFQSLFSRNTHQTLLLHLLCSLYHFSALQPIRPPCVPQNQVQTSLRGFQDSSSFAPPCFSNLISHYFSMCTSSYHLWSGHIVYCLPMCFACFFVNILVLVNILNRLIFSFLLLFNRLHFLEKFYVHRKIDRSKEISYTLPDPIHA